MIKDKELLALLDIVEHGPLALDAPPADWKEAKAEAAAATTAAGGDFEAAGLAFERRWRVLCGVNPDPVEEVASENASGNAAMDEESKRWENFNKKKVKETDYYGLLNLKHRLVVATTEEIKAAYKRGSVVCHPDKAAPEKREKAESRFKAMQRAYETLVDPALKRGYDSSLPFDDDVPDKNEGTGDDFYAVYGPVFAANSRFSVNHPVPELGDANSPFAEVDHFYDFWLSFHSWREFSHLNEHKVEQAGSREEKRWMQRENQKKQAGAKKAEASRVRKLVEGAMDKDPRVKAAREAEKEAKKARKRNRNAEKNKAREEAEAAKAKAEAEAKAAAEAEAAAKAAAKAFKANAKLWRKVVRQSVRRKTFVDWPTEDLELLIEKIDGATLNRIASALCEDFSKRDAPVSPERVESGRAVLEEELAKVKA